MLENKPVSNLVHYKSFFFLKAHTFDKQMLQGNGLILNMHNIILLSD